MDVVDDVERGTSAVDGEGAIIWISCAKWDLGLD